MKPEIVAGVVGDIYEAALDPRRWVDVLNVVQGIYPDSRVTMFRHRGGRPSDALTFHRNFAADDLRAYVDYFVGNSPFVAGARRLTLGRPTYSEFIISNHEFFKTEHYNDFVRPRRLGHYSVGVLLERDAHGMTAFSIADHKDDERRRAHQRRLLDIISPHLLRAIRLHDVTARHAAAANASRAAFDHWTHPAFVLESSGRLVTMNEAATRLLKREPYIRFDRDGLLCGIDAESLRALEHAVGRCATIANNPGLTSGQHPANIALPRPAPGPALQAMVWPLPHLNEYPQFDAPQGRVLLIIFDPLQAPRTPIGWLTSRYGLAPSEAKLTEAIVNGVPLADAAQQLGIQLSTARTRLKIIQSKTGCSRQVDLVRLALSRPSLGQN